MTTNVVIGIIRVNCQISFEKTTLRQANICTIYNLSIQRCAKINNAGCEEVIVN